MNPAQRERLIALRNQSLDNLDSLTSWQRGYIGGIEVCSYDIPDGLGAQVLAQIEDWFAKDAA